MKIELPLTITCRTPDKEKAEILIVLINRKLKEPSYYKKLQKVIDEALEETINDLKK